MRARLALGTVKMLAPSSNFKQTILAPRGVLLNRRASAACRASRSTRAMAKNKLERYARITDFGNDLCAALSGSQPMTAVPAPMPYTAAPNTPVPTPHAASCSG